MKPLIISLVVLGLGCGRGRDEAPSPPPEAPASEPGPSADSTDTAGADKPGAGAPAAASCADRAAELETWLTAVFDPAQEVAPPWPSGDATTDAEVDKLRAEARALARPRDPAAKAEPLTAGVTPGRLEQELASCPQARAQLGAVGTTPPAERRAAMVAIADGIAACDCKVNLPLVKALLYLGERGPDAAGQGDGGR